MRNSSFSGTVEILLVLALSGAAALAFVIWREHAWGLWLLYAAVRIPLCGL